MGVHLVSTSRVVATVFAAMTFLAAAPVHAFDPAILESVVSVLPDWPEDSGPARADPQRLEVPEGTGVAILAGGYIATNAHVLGRAAEVRVRLADGQHLPAAIVGRDTATDIALLRIEWDLPVPAFGPAPPLGDRVCVVGNAFGLGLSVTCGVVSARHRAGTGFNPIEDFIQTDASVNPGASGGALVDSENRLVGVVSAIFTKGSDADIGINFAASMALVMRIAEDLRDHGRVIRGRAGFGFADLTDEQRDAGLVGVRVVRVRPDGAAARAGLAEGDLIVSIAGRPIRQRMEVPAALHLQRPDVPIEITVIRDGETRNLTLSMDP